MGALQIMGETAPSKRERLVLDRQDSYIRTIASVDVGGLSFITNSGV